jgi:hypothetical protein
VNAYISYMQLDFVPNELKLMIREHLEVRITQTCKTINARLFNISPLQWCPDGNFERRDTLLFTGGRSRRCETSPTPARGEQIYFPIDGTTLLRCQWSSAAQYRSENEPRDQSVVRPEICLFSSSGAPASVGGVSHRRLRPPVKSKVSRLSKFPSGHHCSGDM